MRSIGTCIRHTSQTSPIVLANSIYCNSFSKYNHGKMVFVSLENLKTPGKKVSWVWLEIRQVIDDCD